MNLKEYRVFYRAFNKKGKVLNTTVTAKDERQAEKMIKTLRPRAYIVAVFSVNKTRTA